MAPVMTPKTARPAAVARPAGAARRFAKIAMGGVAAVALSTLPANAFEVKMGGDDGSLAFVPDKISVKAGEEIKFVNNAGFPHNIVFDEDEVPAGVNADALSAEEYLNSKGETVTRKLDKAGTYGIYCEPHGGAGMKATITVS